MSIRITDIAKKAGVTPGTVSAALSGKGRISQHTRMKIRELAHDLGYTPNVSAQILKNKIPFDIKYLIRDYNYMASSIPDFLRFCESYSLCYQIEFIDTDIFNKPVESFFKDCKGALYIGYITPAIKEFIHNNPDFPFVSINEISPYCVLSNLFNGTRNAIEYLLARGRRKIAFALCDFEYATHVQINNAIAEVQETFQFETHPEWIYRYSKKPDIIAIQKDTRIWAEKLFSSKNLPDAFFCSGIHQARSIIYEAMKRNLRVPDDIALIAHGGEELATDAFPHITNLSLNYARNIQEGLILLQARITRQHISEKHILTETQLIPRHSTEKRFAV